MSAIIHCLRVWRHYVLGSRFLILTDNSGKANVVADALSRKAEFASITQVTSPLLGRIKEGLQQETLAQSIIALGNRIYVPKWGNLRKKLIKECHDSLWAGHPGMRRTLALLKSNYYWPQMQDVVEEYVQTCLVCQQDKVVQHQPGGLLDPLPIPDKPWESVSMDFITCLPKSDGFGSIIVVVDRFSKYATFIAASPDCTTEEAAKLFLRNVVKLWGVPSNIVSDRDPRFTGRHYVSANQRDWAKLLDVAQFSYNLQQSEATNRSPFEIIMGHQTTTPLSLATRYEGKSPTAFKIAKSWHEQNELARAALHKAAKRMKKWADKKRRPLEFKEGDLVMLKLLPQQFKTFRKVHKGLVRRYEGPFPIIKRVGRVSYKLQLLPRLKIYPVFHVSLLKPYHGDMEDPSREVSTRAPTGVVTSFDKEVEEVLADRVI
ncbi:hypothetical protein V6N11_059054 [Hibiscus sabdariffa]|uniref:Integrase catalytic domain-containing protein n=1 Tax=Hibiscus sabdariffa TaxID=183260 RepID=A0ABR2U618_9ROSI